MIASLTLCSAYLRSGVEWLSDVPVKWQMRQLRDLVEMRVSDVDKHVNHDKVSVRICNDVDVYRNDHISRSPRVAPMDSGTVWTR